MALGTVTSSCAGTMAIALLNAPYDHSPTHSCSSRPGAPRKADMAEESPQVALAYRRIRRSRWSPGLAHTQVTQACLAHPRVSICVKSRQAARNCIRQCMPHVIASDGASCVRVWRILWVCTGDYHCADSDPVTTWPCQTPSCTPYEHQMAPKHVDLQGYRGRIAR